MDEIPQLEDRLREAGERRVSRLDRGVSDEERWMIKDTMHPSPAADGT
jgi:hypothetical protein